MRPTVRDTALLVVRTLRCVGWNKAVKSDVKKKKRFIIIIATILPLQIKRKRARSSVTSVIRRSHGKIVKANKGWKNARPKATRYVLRYRLQNGSELTAHKAFKQLIPSIATPLKYARLKNAKDWDGFALPIAATKTHATQV